ncbi:4-vinyl reductase [Halomonas titanicae]|uniref:4-vinyl reductase n=1 Tax=Vreelandella titanicae TaxID=664683 RepID=UPI001580D53B
MTKVESVRERVFLHGEFLWKHSIKDEMHAKFSADSLHDACWMENSYSSGFLTALICKRIVVREVECAAVGDHVCRSVAKPIEDWDSVEQDLKYFQPQAGNVNDRPFPHSGKRITSPFLTTPLRPPHSD